MARPSRLDLAPPGGRRYTCRALLSVVMAGRFTAVSWVAETGSTNSDCMALARDGAAEGAVVVADHQKTGRGRQGRTWVAPSGASLLVSVLLRPPAAVAGMAGMAAGLAMAEAVDEATAGVVTPSLKWPNDLVVDDRKLAGILAEADWPAGSAISGGYRAPATHDRAVVVVGVGLNVTWPRLPADGGGDLATRDLANGDLAGTAEAVEASNGTGGDDALAEVAGIATALNWVGAPVERVDVLVAFLRRLDVRYRALVGSGAADLLAEWRRRSATLGRRVRVDLGADDVEGTAVDVTAEGHLVVETLEGDRRTLAVGDVVHLRPL